MRGSSSGRRTGLVAVLDRSPAPGAAAPHRRDTVLGASLVTIAMIEGALRTDLVWPIATTVVTAALLATLPWRRTHPLAVVALATGAGSSLEIAQVAAGHTPTALYTSAALILAPYALFRWGSGRAVAAGTLLLVAGFAVSVVSDAGGLGDALAGTAALVLVAVLGELVRVRAAARTRDLEQERLRERSRIARDLHDTLAHALSAIAVRAQAGQVAAAHDAAAAARALGPIEREARAALADVRAIVGTLRTDDETAGRSPVAGLADLAALATSAGTPAVEVHLPDDLPPVPPPVATAAYRIAQEAVTNARRHARGATRIGVQVGCDRAVLTLQVHDDGTSPGDASNPGHGIAGMTERAEILGGRCTAGPDAGGGWTVTAALPTGADR